MASFHTKLGTFFLFFLLLGVFVEGFGQGQGNQGGGNQGGGNNDRDCTICVPSGNAGRVLIQSAFLSDSSGDRVNVESDCDGVVGVNEIFLTFTYTSNRALDFARLLSTIRIIDDSDLNNAVTNFEFNIDIELVNTVNTGNGGLADYTLKITLPEGRTFNCGTQGIQLFNTRVFSRAQGEQILDLCSVPVGQCTNSRDPIIDVGVEGLVFDFDFQLSCFNNQVSSFDFMEFFVSRIAGAGRNPSTTWNVVFLEGGGTFDVTSGGLRNRYSSVLKDSRIQVSLNVTNGPLSNTITKTFRLSDFIFDVDENQIIILDDDELTTAPDGSVSINVPNPENFFFIWRDNAGNVVPFDSEAPRIDPDNPNILTNLKAGEIYSLEMIELDPETGLPTGASSCFEFPIRFVQLPVIYADLSLTFNPEQRAVNFRWSSTKEWEASHFEVERADRGNKFHKIGEVNARGWSDELTQYNFEDKNLPLTGGNLLYRLKQVDFNGRFEYSEVLSVRQVPKMEFTQGVWRAFPNPTNGSAFNIGLLDRSQYEDEPLTFRLVHPLIQTASISVNTEMEMNQQLAQHISRMPSGVFVVEIQWGRKIEHIKVMKK